MNKERDSVAEQYEFDEIEEVGDEVPAKKLKLG
jgi:hypothetical protein